MLTISRLERDVLRRLACSDVATLSADWLASSTQGGSEALGAVEDSAHLMRAILDLLETIGYVVPSDRDPVEVEPDELRGLLPRWQHQLCAAVEHLRGVEHHVADDDRVLLADLAKRCA